jgi:putative N6-adenine-specific DNA methylase
MEHTGHNHEFTATTLSGLEEVCARELQTLGAIAINQMNRAVSFSGGKELMYRANYESRTALRILKPIYTFAFDSATAYYEALLEYKWEELFDVSTTFSIEAVGNHPVFTNTMFAVQRCKDAIADRFRKLYGERPSVSLDDPGIQIHVYLKRDQAIVSLDSSGEPLF